MYGLDPASWSGGRGATYRLLFSDEIECEPASMGQKQQAETNKQGTAQQQEEILLPRIRWIVDEKFDPQSTSNDESGKKIHADEQLQSESIRNQKAMIFQHQRNFTKNQEISGEKKNPFHANEQLKSGIDKKPTGVETIQRKEIPPKIKKPQRNQRRGQAIQANKQVIRRRDFRSVNRRGARGSWRAWVARRIRSRDRTKLTEREREVPRGVVSLWGYW